MLKKLVTDTAMSMRLSSLNWFESLMDIAVLVYALFYSDNVQILCILVTGGIHYIVCLIAGLLDMRESNLRLFDERDRFSGLLNFPGRWRDRFDVNFRQ